MINPIELLGFAAGLLTAVSVLPQLLRTLRKKEASDVSPLMFIILIAGVGSWLIYGILKKDLPLILANVLSLLLNCTMLALRFKYKR